jgi:hypothetical protein
MNHLSRYSFLPMPHPDNLSLYRVPLWIDEDGYMLSVGQSEYRNFTDKTLPDVVKAKLSMIRAFPKFEMSYYDMNHGTPYINMHDTRLNNIGWQVTNDMYMLVIDVEELNTMRLSHDTRAES